MSDRVRVLQTIRSDIPFGRTMIAEPGVYECERTQLGAVCILVDGQRLGVKPGEFEEIETDRLRMKDLTVNEHQSLMEEIADSLRFRPMRSAPKDGTVIEVVYVGGNASFAFVEFRAAAFRWVSPLKTEATIIRWREPDAWRPAHPEWGEEKDG